MTAPSTSALLRNEAIDFIHSEIDRIGVDNLDRSAIVRAYMAKGAARSRIYDWLKSEIEAARDPAPPAPDPIEAEVARAEAMIAAAGRAAPLNALPSKNAFANLEREASAAVRAARVPALPSPEADSPESAVRTGPTVDETGAPVSFQPGGGGGIGKVMAKLERAIDTVDHCITYAYGENGKIRNPRMALAASDGLRRCLETTLKLHEAVDNVQAVQRFMDEIMAALRDVTPDVAATVVERLRGVTARWAK